MVKKIVLAKNKLVPFWSIFFMNEWIMNLYIYILNATNSAQKVAFLLLFVFMTENAHVNMLRPDFCCL